MNGYFQLICGDKLTKLQVFPPTDGGMAVSMGEILEYLTNRNIAYDNEALHSVIGRNEAYAVVINNETKREERESYKIVVNPDKMTAIVRFYPSSHGGENITKKEFMDDLGFKGIKYGIQEEEIDKYFEKRRYCEDIIVARGKEPRHGSDAYIEYYFKTDLKAKPTLKEDGSVDFFHLNTINHCHKGEVIARLFPEDAGESGTNVAGERIKPRDVKKKVLKYSRNVTLSEDKLSMISEVDGHVTLVDEKVFVSDVLAVDNVDNSTGNIDYEGSVKIKGNVCANFTVKARGNIEVQGVVEGAYLEAGGDIIIARGMNGMNRGILRAQGNIISKFMENTTAMAGGYVSAESILHSTVQSASEITVSGRRGFITGGRVSATNTITVKTLGSSMGADTIIEVGADPTIKVRIQELQKDIMEATKVVRSVQPLLAATQQKLAKGMKLPPDQIQYMKSLIMLNKEKAKEIEEKTEEIDRIQEAIGNMTGAQVVVTGVVFAGTRICIGDVSMVVKNEMQYCKFLKIDGEVKMTAL
ncbi:DUF342 domain-containing protein [Kineothrix sp. MB12-C1]|uniref:DUF342 domain-containing protein n=1 Tax=Kineothrix sp. MB12-C1 TaxID=3070215 RepID=UPI0027D22CDC|nr:FapA family protein [Kineothrix sp. MB12-C1]WMC92990.1 FapA family protein [Kineothrix sp. MB12-C1]